VVGTGWVLRGRSNTQGDGSASVRALLEGLVGRPAPDREPAEADGRPRLILGLGNPGPGYARHRHNIGFMVLDRFADRHGLRFDRREANALVASGEVAGRPLVLAKPQTWMNRSGAAARPLVQRYTRRPAELLVVYDDLDLPLGRLRLRAEGSAGGHNGMRDIIAALGTQAFPRLRLGIGRPPAGEDPADYVLSPFTPDERPLAEQMLDDAVAALELILREGVARAMSEVNRARA
jgi:PTH1 family peptidyl-tRNA hydrolase